MGVTIQGHHGSTLEVEEGGLTIHLPKQVFGKAWQAVKSHLLEAIGQEGLIVFTQRVMTQRAEGADAPRWKETLIDVLSWVLFLLKVPMKHALVNLWPQIDWCGINRIGSSEYHNAHGGRRAWAPAQLMALLILMFLYGVSYETQIVTLVQENIVWCWFCGFSLFGPFPRHDALYEFRKRLGVARFEQLLTLVVHACLEAGLVKNELVHFDLTDVTASAHRFSPYERAVILARALSRYLELVWSEQQPEAAFPEALRQLAVEVALEVLPHKALEQVASEKIEGSLEKWEAQAMESTPAWQASSDVMVEELVSEQASAQQASAQQASVEQASVEQAFPELADIPVTGLRTWLAGIAKQIIQRLPHARGDQEARVGRTTNYTWFCGYLMGFVVDNLHQVITAVAWGAGNVKQSVLFIPAFKEHIKRLGKPEAVAVDSAFDDPDVHAYLDEEGIVGHVTSRAHAQPKDGGYGTDKLSWSQDEGHPFCPAQQPLQPKGKPQQGCQTYEGSACHECALYARCYPSGEGEPKRFSIKPDEHRRWQENRQHCQTEAYKEAHKARFVAEGRFGLAKSNHHAAKAPYRSDEMNHIAALIIAIVMNYRLLVRHTSQKHSLQKHSLQKHSLSNQRS